ncbi:hypothetical protein FHS24_001625 [Psychrobacter luti]|uniref:SH3 domain protein n=1 Tax=Psychrobacter luti TaxID=198481 RepID=A0A839TD60_9GAMM|nr:hypothetical protein [Psychrobacter luti]MBB3107108.1 hypothetical protein [Psychrobacter luti]
MIKRSFLLNSSVSNHVTNHTSERAYGRVTNVSVASLILLASLSVQAAPTVTNADPAAGTATLTPNAVLAPNNVNQITPSNTGSTMVSTTAPNLAASDQPATNINDTLAAQLQPSNKALSEANQELLSRNAQLQRQVNDLQTQVNVLVYESKGQLFLYGAFTVLISLLVGIFISWLVFVRRERW